MTINSMTGFARASGSSPQLTWQWELKSVNGKALDVRLRLPPGFDHLEAAVRRAVTQAIKRGNLQVGLSLVASQSRDSVKVNTEMLRQLTAMAEDLRDRLGGGPIQAENLLALRGVVEVSEPAISEAEAEARDKSLMASLEAAVAELVAARAAEGTRLRLVLESQLTRIADLAAAASASPARSADAIRQRMKDQVARLIDMSTAFDESRLHQEAILVATRADIQEELDRLNSHIEAARELLTSPEPVGRKFEFLAQEFNREANTLCSKAIDKTLTTIGLDLKTVIDQMREQVQNIE